MEKSQYFLAFLVIASMLLVTEFPPLVIFFFAVFAYLVMKMFSAAGSGETREIFEFYLTANEMLRDDDRRWFGFEIQEAARRGENISKRMLAPPPLLTFALGALYNKLGDHRSAVTCFEKLERGAKDPEMSITDPSPEVRSYVRVLRKIERDPADAPLTSNAIRSLERARKTRMGTLLAASRAQLEHSASSEAPGVLAEANTTNGLRSVVVNHTLAEAPKTLPSRRNEHEATKTQEEKYSNRKPITEVLHDIYDTKLR